MSAQRTVSIQEAVHLVDNLDLVICSEKFTYMSLRQGASLVTDNTQAKKKNDIITRYRNRSTRLEDITLDQYFYKHFCQEVLNEKSNDSTDLTKHRVLLPVGQNNKPRYPVTYDYAKAVLIQHKPWSKAKPLTSLLKNKQKTIQVFNKMIQRQEFPSSVTSQYILAVKYSQQRKLELLHSKSVEQPYDLSHMNDDERDRYIAHQQVSHLTDDTVHNKVIHGLSVDIGEDEDWTQFRYDGARKTRIPGEHWVDHIREVHQDAVRQQALSVDELTIPRQKDGSSYDVHNLSKEQQNIVYTAVDTVLKFLTNDPSYKPMRATIMGPGGTGKSHVINAIIGIIRKMSNSNDTVQIAAPSGAAAYNVQGSTIHNLLGVKVHHPEKPLSDKTKQKLFEQLERLLVLIIDERSMVSSNVLAAAERNTRDCIYRGQNSNELWGGLPVVLLFGDDYQLMPVTKNGAINSFAKRKDGVYQHVTEKMTDVQLLAYHGDWLFTEVMTDKVYFLTKNYRVKCKQFEEILSRVRKGNANYEDAERLMKNHRVFYKNDRHFTDKIENHHKTMWLYSNNAEVQDKNTDKLVQTSRSLRVPVARLNCHFETNKLQGHQTSCPVRRHFETNSYLHNTNICVGARVALRMWNILPSAGLYNGAIGTVVEIAYKDRPVGPNDKEHYHLPDYVVVDFPNLKLPPHIQPWDQKHPTVSVTISPLYRFPGSQYLLCL